jgi:uncharacterized protein YdeI (YjbR/CyaY-like superfamily)
MGLSSKPALKPRFFATPAELRAWLRENHAVLSELWVGFYKRGSGRPSITWPESVDQALCFGWIDGVRKSLDESSYVIRFTPRKPSSTWSAINIKRARELAEEELMSPSGLAACERRSDERSAIYSYEQRKLAEFSEAQKKRFAANRKAWAFFQNQPPWYRRTATFWVTSAKKEETQAKRLATLIEASAKQRSIAPLKRQTK